MDSFVKKCRREWKRLRVPDAVANEMAADLEADLKEAEAEGASPEDVLGSAVFDPRSFAASWAAERGVIPAPESKPSLNGRTPFVVAAVILAMIAALGAGMVIASGVGSNRLEALAAAGPPIRFPGPVPCSRLELPRKVPPVTQPCQGHQPGSTFIRPWQGAATIVKPPAVLRVIGADVLATPRLATLGWLLIIVGVTGLALLWLVSRFRGRRGSRPAPLPTG